MTAQPPAAIAVSVQLRDLQRQLRQALWWDLGPVAELIPGYRPHMDRTGE